MAAIDRVDWNNIAITYGNGTDGMTEPLHYLDANGQFYVPAPAEDNAVRYLLEEIYRSNPAGSINWSPKSAVAAGDAEISHLLSLYHNGQISRKKILTALGLDELEVVREFVVQSMKEAEASLETAERDGDREQYDWWCGFTEALGEVMAKITEVADTTEYMQAWNDVER
jgi:hypothetical protein